VAALTGKRVLVTRAEGQADELVRELGALGAEVVLVPLLAFADPPSFDAIDRAIEGLAGYRAIVFTSTNAVARLRRRAQLRVGSCDVPSLPDGAKVLAVGPRTAAALAERGVAIAAIPDEYRAESLAEELLRIAGPMAGARVLLPRALAGSDDLPERVRAAGGVCDVVAVYRTVLPDGAAARLRAELAKKPDAITLASGSAAEHLVEALGGIEEARARLAGVRLAAIGPVTAARVRELGLPEPVVAARARARDLADALVNADYGFRTP